jgi:hypothetical protein
MCKYNKKMGDESDIFGGSTEGMAIGLIVLGLFIVLGGGGYWWSSRKPATSTVVVVGAAKTIADVEKKAADMVAEVKTTEAKKITKAEIAEAKTPAQIADAVVKENARLQGIENEKVAKKLIADNAAKKLIDDAAKCINGTSGCTSMTRPKCTADLQTNGNFVIKDNQSKPLWSSGVYPGIGYSPYNAYMQEDGNFVVYDQNKKPIWATDTHNQGVGPYKAMLEENCSLSVYDKNERLWNSSQLNSLGCYEETYGDRIFSNHIPGSHTVKSCNAYAKKNNHDVFGIQYGDECWMGSKAKKYDKFPNLSCPTPRVGYPYGTGGSFISNVYGTV